MEFTFVYPLSRHDVESYVPQAYVISETPEVYHNTTRHFKHSSSAVSHKADFTNEHFKVFDGSTVVPHEKVISVRELASEHLPML